MIRAFASMFLEEPHATTRSYRSVAEKVGEQIFVVSHRPEPYYTAAYALYKLEYAFRTGRLPGDYKPARFHILLAARLLANPSKLPAMNSHEMERYCGRVNETLWDSSTADSLLFRASDIVKEVAKDNFQRDNIRNQAFTEAIKARCLVAAARKGAA